MAMVFKQGTLTGGVQGEHDETFKLGYKRPSTPRPGTGRGWLYLPISIQRAA